MTKEEFVENHSQGELDCVLQFLSDFMEIMYRERNEYNIMDEAYDLLPTQIHDFLNEEYDYLKGEE